MVHEAVHAGSATGTVRERQGLLVIAMARPSNRRNFLYLSFGGASTLVFGCGEDAERIPFEGVDPGGTEEGEGDGGFDDDSDDDAGSHDGDGGTGGATDDGSGDDLPGDDTDGDGDSTGEIDWDCDDPFEGGEYLDSMSFLGEGDSYIGNKSGSGHDARLAFDLGTLTDRMQTVSNAQFFIRTEYPDLLDPSAPFNIQIHGMVASDYTLPASQLTEMPQVTETVMLECSGNGDFSHFGLMSAAQWSGVPLADVLALVQPTSGATRVLISGFDQHTHVSTHSTNGASWVFTLQELEDAGAFLATHMNGQPLPPDHGAPVRLICPRWYGCCNIKWVNEIELVGDDVPSTAQMREFASRTHQTAAHNLARDFAPATMQQAAMPVRVEKWRVDGQILYKIIGIMWGGSTPTDALTIRFDGGAAQDVDVCPPQQQNMTWTLWSYAWQPASAGDYQLDMEISDPGIATNRLDSGFYRRWVHVNEV